MDREECGKCGHEFTSKRRRRAGGDPIGGTPVKGAWEGELLCITCIRNNRKGIRQKEVLEEFKRKSNEGDPSLELEYVHHGTQFTVGHNEGEYPGDQVGPLNEEEEDEDFLEEGEMYLFKDPIESDIWKIGRAYRNVNEDWRIGGNQVDLIGGPIFRILGLSFD